MIRAILLLLLAGLFCLTGHATEPTTKEQREKLIFLVRKLEQEPFAEPAVIGRGWAMEFVQNASDINPRVNLGMLKELMDAKVPALEAIFAQYILAASVFVIEHPDLIKDESANAVASFTGALRVYEKAVKRDPENRIPFWETLAKHEKAGTLKAHVEQLLKQQKARPREEGV
jgi:hypothetical protein